MALQKHKFTKTVLQYSILLLGTAILSFGLYNIHSQSHITEGGVLGLTLLLQHWLGISPGITGICIDSICYLIGLKVLGKVFLKNALIASIGFSFFYNIYERFGYVIPNLSGYPIVASILGGIFVGIGVGLIVRCGGASGGDDALALVIAKALKCNIAKAYLATDVTVLLLSLSYIPVQKIIYSFITVTISSTIIGWIHKWQHNQP